MKKLILLFLFLPLLLSGCTTQTLENTQSNREEPRLYWQDIDVVITSVEKKHWYASTHWYEVGISVESEEYQLTYTDTFKGSGAFGCLSQWDYEEGDVIKAQLYSWVMDSTGEIVKREIHRVY